MHRIELLGQPASGTVRSLLGSLAGDPGYTKLDVSVAYVTSSGVNELTHFGSDFAKLSKRFLVGIDWCRSDPPALRALEAMPKSTVRVHDGANVVHRLGCVPHTSFHPKGFLFRGADSCAGLLGSANLSRNGLAVGHELDVVIEVKAPASATEVAMRTRLQTMSTWFGDLWSLATPLASIITAYDDQYAKRLRNSIPNADDAVQSARTIAGRRGALTPDDLVILRASPHLWIQAGNLHLNNGPKRPGNQLMLKAMSRVFFDFDATDVPRDSFIGHVPIAYGTHAADRTRTLRFSNNSMDVLTLPMPGPGGPSAYDRETLLFTRVPSNRGVVFDLKLATGTTEAARWKRWSDTRGKVFKMTSGREFGVF